MTDSKHIITCPQVTFEYPAPGLVLERTASRTLCVFTIRDNRSETVDAWANCAKQAIDEWDVSLPCLLAFDLRKMSAYTFNSQIIYKFEELYRFRPGLDRFVAMILPSEYGINLAAQLAIRIRELTSPQRNPQHWELFSQRRHALQWLARRCQEKYGYLLC